MTLVALQDRHPAPPHNCRTFQDHRGNLRFQPLYVSWILRRTRWSNSTTSPWFIIKRHWWQPADVHHGLGEHFVSWRSVYKSQQDNLQWRANGTGEERGGIRPIAVGYTWWRLEAKCANRHIISRRSTALHPIQMGVGVSGGAEAANHATRYYVNPLTAAIRGSGYNFFVKWLQ